MILSVITTKTRRRAEKIGMPDGESIIDWTIERVTMRTRVDDSSGITRRKGVLHASDDVYGGNNTFFAIKVASASILGANKLSICGPTNANDDGNRGMRFSAKMAGDNLLSISRACHEASKRSAAMVCGEYQAP